MFSVNIANYKLSCPRQSPFVEILILYVCPYMKRAWVISFVYLMCRFWNTLYRDKQSVSPRMRIISHK